MKPPSSKRREKVNVYYCYPVGFNTPYMQNGEDRIYVNIVEQLIFKDTGVLYKTIELENWLITESNKEELLDANGNICEVEWQEINEMVES